MSDAMAKDRSLVGRCLEGCNDAHEELGSRLRCVEYMLLALNQRLGKPLPPEELEDLVQDTLLSIWQRLDRYQARATVETWAYGFCSLCFRSHLRKYRLRRSRSVSIDLGAAPAAAEGGKSNEQWLRLLRLLRELDTTQASILELKHQQRATFGEISKLLRMPQSTVKSHYYRGLECLRRLIKNEERQRP